MGLPRQFLSRNRNEVALNLFLASKLSTHDFGGAIVLISVKREVKCNFTGVRRRSSNWTHTRED